MGVPTSAVGYTPTVPRREDHEVHKGHMVALEKKMFIFRTVSLVKLGTAFDKKGIKRRKAYIVNNVGTCRRSYYCGVKIVS